MFDNFAAYFFENVVTAYDDYARGRNSGQAGQSADIKAALVAASALFHLREHVPAAHRKTRDELSVLCPDYGLLGDIANASKHKGIWKNHPRVAAAKDIYEEVVITEYRDDRGPYRHAEKRVTVRLVDGSTRNVFEILTVVMNLWIDELSTLGLIPNTARRLGPSSQIPPRAAPGEAAPLGLVIGKGIRFHLAVRVQRYNYDTCTFEPMDLIGSEAELKAYAPSYTIDVELKNHKTGESLKRTNTLTEEENRELAAIDADEHRARFLEGVAQKHSEELNEMMHEARRAIGAQPKLPPDDEDRTTMNTLESAMHEALGEVPNLVLAAMIEKKLKAQGVKLSDRALKQLQERVLKSGDDTTFKLRTWKWWERKEVVIEFTDEDNEQISQRLDEFLDHQLPDLLRRAIDESSELILAQLLRDWPAKSRLDVRDARAFREALDRRWGAALDRLKMLLAMSREFGATINDGLRRSGDADRRHQIDVLTRLHARACQTAGEVICLMESGFADGAMARWRTLHEVAVVAMFIHQHGDGVAERYLAHEVIEAFKAAKNYERCQTRLGYEPITAEELATLERARNAAIDRFGKPFKESYGWAVDALGNRKPNPNFSDIDQAVGVDHLRTHYQMASHNVHANPKGVFFNLGMLGESDVLLSGPSEGGLTDPGHCAAISLMHVNVALGLLVPTLDSIVLLRVMAAFNEGMGDAFLEAGREPATDGVAS